MKLTKLAMLCSVGFILSGCLLHDPYDYSNSGGGTGPGPGGASKYIYSPDTDGSIPMMAKDASGEAVFVDGKNNNALKNVQVVGAYLEGAPLTVTATGPSSVYFEATSGGLDYSSALAENDGTVQFDVVVESMPKGAKHPVLLSLKSGDDKLAQVDISSSLSAYSGHPLTHTVKMPLSCFTGVDFANTTQPFGLELSANAEFELGNVRIQAKSGGSKPGINNTVVCPGDDKSELLIADEAWVFERDLDDSGNLIEESGWGAHNAVNGTPDKSQAPAGLDQTIGFAANAANGNGIPYLSFILKDDKLKDISQYIESGALQFYFWLENDSTTEHPSGNFNVKLDTPRKADTNFVPGDYGFPASNVITLDATKYDFSEPALITIPLRDFVVDKDGLVDINVVKHIMKVVFMPEKVEGNAGYSYSGMRFSVADVKFVMNP